MEQHGCDTPEHEMERMTLSRRVAFVDCPGNPFSVPAMLKGIMMADGVLILSQPTHYDGFFTAPTVEVLAAANLMGRSIVVVQIIKNAADQNQLEEHKEQIRSSFSDLEISWDVQIPIVQLSARDLSSIGRICRQIELMPPPTEASDSPALMIIGSSCVVSNDDAAAGDDGEEIDFRIHGRVVQGALTAADEPVEVRPGIVTVGVDKKMVCHPVILKVTSVEQPAADQEKEAADGLVVLRASAKISGGNPQRLRAVLVGGLQGHMLGRLGSLPGVYETLQIQISLARNMWDPYEQKMKPVKHVEENQELLLVIGTMSTYGRVRRVEGDNKKTIVVAGLSPPTCARRGEGILICRKLGLGWHLIGRGEIVAGKSINIVADAS